MSSTPEIPIKPGVWNLRGIQLPFEEIPDAIQSAVNVPDSAKAFLIECVAAVQKQKPKARFCRLDAHSHFANDTIIVQQSVKAF